MNKFFATKIGKFLLCLLVLALTASVAAGGFVIWYLSQPKFQDVTVELGTTSVDVTQFAAKTARKDLCRITGSLARVNLGKVGSYTVKLSHAGKEEQVKLHVVDTTAPEVTFIEELTMPVGYEPSALDFVENFRDYSPVTVSFAETPNLDENHAATQVEILVADATGNEVRQVCTLNIAWMQTEVNVELGSRLSKEQILFAPEEDADQLRQEDIDRINQAGVGEYVIQTLSGETCTVRIQDTIGPSLQLRDWHVYPGESVKIEDFVVSCEDISGFVDLKFGAEPDVKTQGRQTVTIEARDLHGNVTRGEAILAVSNDNQAPSLEGLTEMSVPKHSQPDFMAGVSARDNSKEACQITCDAEIVDLTSAGTYYVTYTATDPSGNVTTAKRKVTVEHDQEDTWALVEEIAKTLENNPEKLRDYVRGKIGYNSNWGGDDPVWYGFNTRGGNCYVHALCLDALLQYYGYETQLIWVKDKTHYWLLINLEGVGWRHIDPTPSQLHGRYSLMTDGQRLSTLSDRIWDFNAWPEAVEAPIQ